MKLFTKANLAKLNKRDRYMVMQYQMSPSYGGNSDYLPDDCSECGACGEPMLGSGWCSHCSNDFDRILNIMRGKHEE